MLARSSSGSVENSKQAQHDLAEPRRGFEEEDRAQLGLLAAVDRLRYTLAYNGLTLAVTSATLPSNKISRFPAVLLLQA